MLMSSKRTVFSLDNVIRIIIGIYLRIFRLSIYQLIFLVVKRSVSSLTSILYFIKISKFYL